ncbi:MAG: tetratricopeptide repeat protein [Bacillota bacterium]|nr:tetratricopeptide repeat protein [Bacillota bacterium]
MEKKESVREARTGETTKRRVARLLSRAAGHLARGNHRYAARALYQAMDEDPHNPDIRRQLAEVLLDSCEDWMVGGALGREWTEQRMTAVIDPLRPLLKGNGDPASLKLLGRIYARFRRYDEAARALHRILATGREDAEAHNLLGRIYLQAGRVDLAGDHFRQALGLYTRDASAMVGAALVEIREGRHNEAIAHLRQAVEVEPSCTEAYCRLGELYLYHLGNLHRASLMARQALLADPQYPMARHLLGMVYYLNGDVEQAVREWQKTVSGLNAYGPSLHTLANVALEQEDYQAARGYLERLLFAYPDDAEAKVKLGLANAAVGDYYGASRLWEEVRRQDRQEGYARVFLADLYASLDRWEEAWEVLEEALTLELPPDLDEQLHDLLLEAYAHCPVYDLASRTVDAAVRRYPSDPAILLAASLVHTGGRSFALAREYAERARRLQPADPGVYRVLGVWHMERGELEEAREVLERGYALNRNDPRTACDLGELQARRGDWEEAMRWWEDACRLDPEDMGYLRRLAFAYQRTGRADKAREAWERYLGAVPEDTAAQVAYGQVCLRQGDLVTCEAVCRRVMARERYHPVALALLGACALRAGDPRDGLRYFKAAWKHGRDAFLATWPTLDFGDDGALPRLLTALRRGRYDRAFKAEMMGLLSEGSYTRG